MSIKTFKPLPVGIEDFVTLREDGSYYVDKTSYLKNVFTDPSSVLLFTRPRRFGKTLLMDMFASFLRVKEDGSAGKEEKEKLFEGLEILKDKDFTDKYMGQFPVIFLSLKSVFGDDFKNAYGKLVELVADLGEQFSFLIDSPRISQAQKEELALLRNKLRLLNPDYQPILTGALKTISNCLYKHYGKRVILLIDEYDVPLAWASEKGYHSQMVTLITQFFAVMKISPSDISTRAPIKKIVLTGCLKVAKNSIFTGINNISVNTVLSEDYDFDSIIGFTKEETLQFLKDYSLEEYASLVKENYDGYRFNGKEIFCPWDVVNFIAEAVKKKIAGIEIIPGNYWINSSSSKALLPYIGFLGDKATSKMQSLMDGENIESYINDSMNYDTLAKHDEMDFFSLLLHTGYLTSDCYKIKTIDGNQQVFYSLKIPNKEIRKCLEVNILEHFREKSIQGENKAMLIAKALLEGNSETASDYIYDLLQSYVSVRDFATKAKPENFYQGFLSGVFSSCTSYIKDFKSNSESGNGYADLVFSNQRRSKVVIIELKVADSAKTMKETALRAIKQIEDKRYADNFMDDLVDTIYSYGISFYKKTCYVEIKKIK